MPIIQGGSGNQVIRGVNEFTFNTTGLNSSSGGVCHVFGFQSQIIKMVNNGPGNLFFLLNSTIGSTNGVQLSSGENDTKNLPLVSVVALCATSTAGPAYSIGAWGG